MSRKVFTHMLEDESVSVNIFKETTKILTGYMTEQVILYIVNHWHLVE